MNGPPTGEIDVLHVDDDGEVGAVTAEFLERADERLSVRTETDAEDGLATLREAEIDCVVSDYDMPGMDGLEFLERVRRTYPTPPFVLFTGKGSEEIASEAISAGVDDYLQKEVGSDQYTVLANRIVVHVERRRAETVAARTDERYHNLVDHAPVPVVLFDPDRELIYANDATVAFLDADSPEDLLGIRMPDLLHDDEVDQALERFERIVEDEEPVPEMEFRVRTLSGNVKRAVVATAPGTYRGKPVAQVVVRQPSERTDE